MQNLLTKRQKDLLIIVYNYIKDSGYPPTFEEMRGALGVSSNQSVLDHLNALVEGKFIKRAESEARGIAILPLGYQALGRPSLVPFLGVTSAGAMVETVEIEGEWQEVSAEVARFKNDVFLVKVSGDSMINAGIDGGDVVLVQSSQEFVSGDIVLAEKRGESTIKRFMSVDEPPYLYLKPENPAHKIILFEDDVLMAGKVVSVLKNGQWKGVK